MSLNINSQLSSVFNSAWSILASAKVTGEIDLSDSDGMFNQMKEVAQNKSAFRIDNDFQRLYQFCLSAPEFFEISESEGAGGFPNEWTDMPKMIVDFCVENKRIKILKEAVSMISLATLDLDTDTRKVLSSDLGGMLESYDLLGEEAVSNIFEVTNGYGG